MVMKYIQIKDNKSAIIETDQIAHIEPSLIKGRENELRIRMIGGNIYSDIISLIDEICEDSDLMVLNGTEGGGAAINRNYALPGFMSVMPNDESGEFTLCYNTDKNKTDKNKNNLNTMTFFASDIRPVFRQLQKAHKQIMKEQGLDQNKPVRFNP